MGDRVTKADAETLAREVRDAPRSGEVGECVLDVLARQAEGRTLFAGAEYIESVVARHALSREMGTTSIGNVFDVLARGPASTAERGLVIAFACSGLARILEKDPERAPIELRSFVRRADWFETSTDYAIYAHVEAMLSSEHARAFWGQLGESIVEDAAHPQDHGLRSRIFVRLSALHHAEHPEARRVLDDVAGRLADPMLQRVAFAASGKSLDGMVDLEVEGLVRRPGTRGFRAALRWITGWALLTWVVRSLGWFVGYEHRARASVVDNRLRLATTLKVLGRILRDREVLIPLYALTRVERAGRYPTIYLATGVIALSLGVLVGGAIVVEGIRSGETILMLVGAALALAGAVLDVIVDGFAPARLDQTSLEIHAYPRLSIAMRVGNGQARAFLDLVSPRLARSHAARGMAP